MEFIAEQQSLSNRLADPGFFAKHRKTSRYWKAGFAHGVLGRQIAHPRRVGDVGYRRANREYNFGYGDGKLEREHLERRFRSWGDSAAKRERVKSNG